MNVLGQRRYSPSHNGSTISCSDHTVDKTTMHKNVLFQRQQNIIRGFDDGSGSSGDGISSNEDERDHKNLISYYHSSNPKQRYKPLLTTVNTSLKPQTFAGTSYIDSKHPEGNIRGLKPPKNCLVINSLTERAPILLDIPNGRNELVMAPCSAQSIPKLRISNCWSAQRVARYCPSSTNSFRFAKNKSY